MKPKDRVRCDQRFKQYGLWRQCARWAGPSGRCWQHVEPEVYSLRDLRKWLFDVVTAGGTSKHIPTMALFEAAVAREARAEPMRLLAIAKKAAEYGRGDTHKHLHKNNPSLDMALRRLDAAIEWADPDDAGHLNQDVVLTGRSIW